MQERSNASRARGRRGRPFALVLGALVLTLSFLGLAASPASAAPTVIPDTGGYDQIDQGNGAQQDIAGVSFDGNTFAFAWDETDLSGNNSSDICTYFQDPDGSVTSICYSVQFESDGSVSPGFPEYTVYDCGSTYGNGKCTGNNPDSTEYSVTCTDPILVAPYFPQDDDQDLQGDCTLTGLNGNDPADLQYINTCTKPSASPSSLSNDCIFDPGEPDPGFLQLVKVVADGTATPTDFTLTATDGTQTVSGAGSTAVATVATGDFALSEASTLITDGTYALDNISCVTDGVAVDATGGTVTVQELATTVCTFTNKVAFVANPDGTIVKTSDVDTFSAAGDVINYTVTVTNTGNVALTPTMSDTLNGTDLPLTGPIGDDGNNQLDPDEVWTYTAQYTVTQDDVENGADLVNTACAGDLDDDGVADCDDDTVTPNPNESVAIVKTADTADYSAAGQTINYTVAVTNTGDISTVPTIEDTLNGTDLPLTGPSGDTDGDARLDLDETWTYTASYTVTQDDLDNGTTLSNVACALLNGESVCSTVVTPPVRTPGIDVVKTSDSPTVDSSGDVINYTVTVNNTGNVALDPTTTDLLNDAISLTLAGPSGDADGDGLLDVTETWTYTTSYTVTQEDIESGAALVNSACAEDAAEGVSDCGETTTTVVQNPDAVVSKSADPTEVDAADTVITYTVVVDNTGNVTIDVPGLIDEINSSIPVALTLASGDTDGDGRLDVTETWTYTGTYTVTQEDMDAGVPLANVACIGDVDGNGTQDPDECDDATTTIVQNPDAVVTKDVSSASVDATGTLTYDITYANTGNVSLAPSLTDTFSNGSLTLDGPFDAAGDPVTAATIAPGETWNYTASYTVTQDDLDNGGSITNQVCIGDVDGNGTDDPDECDDTTTTIVQNPDAVVSKSADPTEVDAADTVITYTVVVDNTGNVTIDVPGLIDEINSSIPVALTLASGDTDGDGRLDVTETWTYTGTYTVTQEDMDAGVPLANVACIGDVDGNGTQDPDECDDATTTIVQNPAHTFVKDFDPDQVEIGEDGTFTLTYTNTGNVTLSDVEITDEVATLLGVNTVSISDGTCEPASQSISCSVSSLAPGETAIVTVGYTAADGAAPVPGQTSGASYIFYFENGYTLYGSTETGDAFLIDPDGNVSPADVDGANQDITFNTPDGQSFNMHLSCSEPFVDGYGVTGPTEADNPEWKILSYDVDRYNSQGLLKSCAQTFGPFNVDNTASASATPAGGTLTPNPIVSSDSVELIQISPIEVSRARVRRGNVEIQYFNTSQEDVEISIIGVSWTEAGVTLESASYQDGVDLGLAGGSPQSASLSNTMSARSKDWLRLDFEPSGAPDGLTVTIVLTTGETLTYTY